MAVAEFSTPLDLEKIRADFPILARPVHGKRLVFLDSAASSQKPRQVIGTLVDVYETSYANVHRGVYYLGARATERYEGARDIMAGFVNAGDRREVIFVREATEALNLVAYAYGRTFVGPGDAIVATEMEHHSNLVPWQFLAQQTGATLHYLRLIVDGAQAAPHRPVDVQALGCDFYALSGHKMCGPGAGILWGRAELLEKMPPFLTGGEMIRTVSLEKTTWNDLPWKFEAGTPAIAESIALGAAAQYLQGIGMEAIEAHEHALTAYAYDVLDGISGVTQYGPKPPNRAGILSFNVGNVHPHDVAQVLDSEGIAVRAGHHCTQPLMRRFDLQATTRASVYLYNGRDDIDALALGIEKVKRTFS